MNAYTYTILRFKRKQTTCTLYNVPMHLRSYICIPIPGSYKTELIYRIQFIKFSKYILFKILHYYYIGLNGSLINLVIVTIL